jgi:hypothetical protein
MTAQSRAMWKPKCAICGRCEHHCLCRRFKRDAETVHVAPCPDCDGSLYARGALVSDLEEATLP